MTARLLRLIAPEPIFPRHLSLVIHPSQHYSPLLAAEWGPNQAWSEGLRVSVAQRPWCITFLYCYVREKMDGYGFVCFEVMVFVLLGK